MADVAVQYVERLAAGGWRIAGSRVSLESVVCLYWEGQSPEAIAEEFPALTAEQVYGAIAYYLGHRADVDQHLAKLDASWKQLRDESNRVHGPLLDRLRSAPTAGNSTSTP